MPAFTFPLIGIYQSGANNCYVLCRYVDIPMPNRENPQYRAIEVWGEFVSVSPAEMEANGRDLILADLRAYLARNPDLNPRGPRPWDQGQLLKDAGLTGLKQIQILLDYPHAGQFCIEPSHFSPAEEDYGYDNRERLFLPVTCSNEDFARAIREAFGLCTGQQ